MQNHIYQMLILQGMEKETVYFGVRTRYTYYLEGSCLPVEQGRILVGTPSGLPP